MLKEILQLIPFGWIVALILGWVAIRTFKPSVHGFLQRANKFKAGSFAAEASPQQIAAENPTDSYERRGLHVPTGDYEELRASIQPFRFGTMTRISKEIHEKLDAQQLTTDQLKQLMADAGAIVVMAIDFENTYSLIYGSQIVTLQDLNSVPGRRMAEVKGVYERGTKSTPELYQNYSFDQWLEFLKSKQLIHKEGDIVNITDSGRDFLRYLVQTGKPMFKPG